MAAPSPVPSEKLALSDLNSSTWAEVQKYVNKRIEVLRIQNDKNQDAVNTAILRGGIDELKRLLNKLNPTPLKLK